MANQVNLSFNQPDNNPLLINYLIQQIAKLTTDSNQSSFYLDMVQQRSPWSSQVSCWLVLAKFILKWSKNTIFILCHPLTLPLKAVMPNQPRNFQT